MAEAGQAGLSARPSLVDGADWSSVAPDTDEPGVRLRQLRDGVVFQVAARRGRAGATATSLQEKLGLAVPMAPHMVGNEGVEIAWWGPDQWLVMSDDAGAGKLRQAMADLGEVASVTDQSDARVVLMLEGKRVREALVKLVGIDLHPGVFSVGNVALMPIAHIPSQLWRRPDGPGEAACFVVNGPRSYAGSLWHAIVDAAAPLGLDARPAPV